MFLKHKIVSPVKVEIGRFVHTTFEQISCHQRDNVMIYTYVNEDVGSRWNSQGLNYGKLIGLVNDRLTVTDSVVRLNTITLNNICVSLLQ
jgi:hypothetical protein